MTRYGGQWQSSKPSRKQERTSSSEVLGSEHTLASSGPFFRFSSCRLAAGLLPACAHLPYSCPASMCMKSTCVTFSLRRSTFASLEGWGSGMTTSCSCSGAEVGGWVGGWVVYVCRGGGGGGGGGGSEGEEETSRQGTQGREYVSWPLTQQQHDAVLQLQGGGHRMKLRGPGDARQAEEAPMPGGLAALPADKLCVVLCTPATPPPPTTPTHPLTHPHQPAFE